MHGFRVAVGAKATGVYLLRRKGKVVYVGQSLNVFHRIAVHVLVRNRHRLGKAIKPSDFNFQTKAVEFDEVEVQFCELKRLDGLEMELIQLHRPQGNDKMNRAPVGDDVTLAVYSLPGFQEAMTQAEKQQILGKQWNARLRRMQMEPSESNEDRLDNEDLRSLGV